MEVDLLVLEREPAPLDEDVVPTAARAVHADLDAVIVEQPREGGAGEVGALIGVEDGRRERELGDLRVVGLHVDRGLDGAAAEHAGRAREPLILLGRNPTGVDVEPLG